MALTTHCFQMMMQASHCFQMMMQTSHCFLVRRETPRRSGMDATEIAASAAITGSHLQSRPSREHGNDSSLRTESHCHCISYALQQAEFEHVPLSHVYDMNRRVVINVCRLRLPCCKQVPRKYFQVNSSKAQHRQHPFLPL